MRYFVEIHELQTELIVFEARVSLILGHGVNDCDGMSYCGISQSLWYSCRPQSCILAPAVFCFHLLSALVAT